ncbi:hypothetical protein FXO38_07912 [Capsicum annuum]|nr:hypothetical protein FXO38_07912 [Capsicum annuum]KAF3670993.1 hypothetical protein FXO37_08266 [Capsicum annuum]
MIYDFTVLITQAKALVSPFLLDDYIEDAESNCLSDYQGQNWGQVDNSRYDFFFVCVNASLTTLDLYVDRTVDHMVDGG